MIVQRRGRSVNRFLTRPFLAVVVATFGLFAAAVPMPADDQAFSDVLAIERTFIDVIAKAESGIVSISRRDERADSEPQQRFPPFRGRGGRSPTDLDDVPEFFGTGVVIGTGKAPGVRYVLTNDHVLRGGRPEAPLPETAQFDVVLSDHRRVRANVVAADPRSDLAVLQLDLTGSSLAADQIRPLKLGDASTIRKGQLVLAMGNPYAIARDGSASASWGIVSNVSRRPEVDDDDATTLAGASIHQYGTLLHVDTRLDLGMSGGALLNLKGELVGLTTALAALQGYEKSVGYAIPIDRAMRRIINDLLQGYEVEYGFLGIVPVDADEGELRVLRAPRRHVSAARAHFVAWDSPAGRAGLVQGDLVTAINDKPILGAYDLMREIGLLGPDTVARLSVWRPDGAVTLRPKLGKWPVHDDSRIVATRTRYPIWRGLLVDYPTARRRLQTSDVMDRYHRAVLVSHVEEQSIAAAAGIRVGDYVTHVGEVPVETPEEFHMATARLRDSATLVRLDGSQVELSPAAPPGR